MENGIPNKTGSKKNGIINLFGFFVGFLPFIYSIYCAIYESHNFLIKCSIILIGMAGTLMAFGLIGEARKDHGAGILCFVAIFVSLLSGLFFLLNRLF